MTAAHNVRFATWNILSGRRLDRVTVDLDAVAGAIASLDADVVALQEVDRCLERTGNEAQLEEIARATG